MPDLALQTPIVIGDAYRPQSILEPVCEGLDAAQELETNRPRTLNNS